MNEFRDIHGLLNHFWQMRRSTFFTSLEADLYFALLDEANTRRWKETFSISNGWLTAKIGTSEPSLIRARNKLKQCGLIEFVSGKTKRQPSKYSITYVRNYLNNFSKNVSPNFSSDGDYLNNFSSNVSESVSSNVSPSVRQVKTKDIRHKNKTNTEYHDDDFSKENFEEEVSKNQNFEKPTSEEISEPPVETENASPKKVALKKGSQKSERRTKPKQRQWDAEIDTLKLPFDSEAFLSTWSEFREERNNLGYPMTLNAAKRILNDLGRYEEKIALASLDQAIQRGYRGVFPKNILREQNYQVAKNTNQTITKPDFANADYTDTTL